MDRPLILVVEDDKAVKNLIATTLEMHDYHYIWADKGEQGILSAASQRPDIILLDLGLPDMDGVDVILKIRSWTNTPIIVISARSEDSDKIAALDAAPVPFPPAQTDFWQSCPCPGQNGRRCPPGYTGCPGET